jgi:hypothetical protein
VEVMNGEKFIRASDARKAVLKADPKSAYCIDSIPAVDAVEVVHGRWIHHYHDSGEPIDDKWYCSECHMCNGHRRTLYCPNCGAKMDLEV